MVRARAKGVRVDLRVGRGLDGGRGELREREVRSVMEGKSSVDAGVLIDERGMSLGEVVPLGARLEVVAMERRCCSTSTCTRVWISYSSFCRSLSDSSAI